MERGANWENPSWSHPSAVGGPGPSRAPRARWQPTGRSAGYRPPPTSRVRRGDRGWRHFGERL